MGSKWEVWVWTANPTPEQPGPGYGQDYYDVLVPCHQSLLGALWAAAKARRSSHCVRIMWR